MDVGRTDLCRRWVPIVLAQATGLLCGLIGIRLVSQWVSPADYGVFGVFVSLAPVGATVIYAGLVKFISRHWQESTDRPRLLRDVLLGTLRKSWALALTCVAIAMLAAPHGLAPYATLLFIASLLLSVLQLAQSALQAAREHWRDLGVSATASVLRSLMPPLLYAATGGGTFALLAGFAIHGLVAAALGILALRSWWPRSGDAGKTLLNDVYDGPQFVILAAAAWALIGMNRWLVAWRFGAETAGYFNLATNIGAIAPMMLGAVALQFHQPVWFAGRDESAASRQQLLRSVDRTVLAYTVLALLAAILVHLLVPHVVGTLVDKRYLPAAPYILATACSSAAVMIGTFHHSALIAARRERDCVTADLTGAALLAIGSIASAVAGLEWLRRWLVISPLVPWIVNRSIARRAILRSR